MFLVIRLAKNLLQKTTPKVARPVRQLHPKNHAGRLWRRHPIEDDVHSTTGRCIQHSSFDHQYSVTPLRKHHKVSAVHSKKMANLIVDPNQPLLDVDVIHRLFVPEVWLLPYNAIIAKENAW
jgi:hypothetical protein